MYISQVDPYTNPTLISHNAPFCNRNVHVCAFLLQNGALWDICLVHCGINEMGLLYLSPGRSTVPTRPPSSRTCSSSPHGSQALATLLASPANPKDISPRVSGRLVPVVPLPIASRSTGLRPVSGRRVPAVPPHSACWPPSLADLTVFVYSGEMGVTLFMIGYIDGLVHDCTTPVRYSIGVTALGHPCLLWLKTIITIHCILKTLNTCTL